jgi:hypothetical protein
VCLAVRPHPSPPAITKRRRAAPPAYTRYAFFEWGLIFLDIAFDATAARDLTDSGLQVRALCVWRIPDRLTDERS